MPIRSTFSNESFSTPLEMMKNRIRLYMYILINSELGWQTDCHRHC